MATISQQKLKEKEEMMNNLFKGLGFTDEDIRNAEIRVLEKDLVYAEKRIERLKATIIGMMAAYSILLSILSLILN